MGIVAVALSVRVLPACSSVGQESRLPSWRPSWASGRQDGVLGPQRLSRFGHHPRHHHGLLRAHGRLERDLFQPLDSTADWGAGHGVRFPEHAELLVLPVTSSLIMVFSLVRGRRRGIWGLDGLPALERACRRRCRAAGTGMTLWLISMVLFVVELFARWPELHRDGDQPPDQRHEDAPLAA